MRATALTKRQRQALEAIRESLRERKVAPTHAELARAMALSNASAVGGYLAALVRKGWIEIIPSVERGIRLLREGAPIVDAAHLSGAAGAGADAVEERHALARLHDFESLSREFDGRPDFFVRIEGEALDAAGFASGDIVAVRREARARDGDVVLARIGGEVGFSRYRRIDAATVALHPLDTHLGQAPIEVGPGSDGAQIVGVVVGAIVATRPAATDEQH